MENNTKSANRRREPRGFSPEVDIAFGSLDYFLNDKKKSERRTFFNY